MARPVYADNTGAMAAVDPDDDQLDRFVVLHYRYDPSRNERRNMVLGAFDVEHEFRAAMEAAQLELARRKSSAVAETVEYITGASKPAGYTHDSQVRRAKWRQWGRQSTSRS